ncbi:MAG: ferredoxin--nitrite reductase [Cyanobacteria bacterium QS_8_64_29]|nr:MAG: ferredoxin--nitrite reductase [Cyanobacteria bacterium QS_8_64_29]
MSANETEQQQQGSGFSEERTLDLMRKFSETYAQRSGTYFCSDPSITAVVIEGLAKHKEELGAPLCPCRHYEDKEAEVKAGYWNCPCVPMRERKECHCLLFLTEDHDFAGDRQQIDLDYVKEVRQDMT